MRRDAFQRCNVSAHFNSTPQYQTLFIDSRVTSYEANGASVSFSVGTHLKRILNKPFVCTALEGKGRDLYQSFVYRVMNIRFIL